jgi:hypothetical protein
MNDKFVSAEIDKIRCQNSDALAKFGATFKEFKFCEKRDW